MNYKILLFGICLSAFFSCKKVKTKCKADDFPGHYIATFTEASSWADLPDPYEAEFSLENATTLILDYHPDMGFNTKIELIDGVVNIPPQIWTSDKILTSDSSKYWQQQLTGSGTYDCENIEFEYILKSNYYNSNTFEYHSSGRMVFEPTY